ncbi:pyruvate formate-lyase-activating protein [Anaerosacchariphilus polymeriproducens]|uniref:Pyruvate formate-lyase-activating enzyme n=1 Tax=Anaerosacchariphilus polymeriproducens TaxID=1812858 RepID=A0A371AYU5_9FIRM|nr:pyruvate formate-lyase-activating protein [Anaerosacchariphilus polymeriproducens]RDU24774.1 pyruvate formate lyase-activating protein [Anaerosacchariphilus polymeriproducens]
MGKIHSIETMGLVDGPGIRTVLFFQGCSLRCQYCHNPDTWDLKSGKEMNVTEIIKILKRYQPYYGETGGVTCSGGEPLLQAEFLIELFKQCKKEDISTCLDTAGYGNGDYNELLEYTDLVLFDVKHYIPEMFRKLTGGNFNIISNFLDALKKSGTPIWIRHVIVPGLTDTEEHIRRLKDYISGIPNVEKIELLPYHTLGAKKYEKMGIDYPLKDIEPMDKEETKKLQNMILNIES